MSKKDAYIKKSQATIMEYTAKLDVLKAKAKGEVADLKIDAYEQIEKLETKLKTAKSRLSDLTNAAEDKWQGLSDRFEELTDEIGASIKKLIDKYK